MAFAEIIKTFLEFAVVVLLIIGFINERKVIDFEDKLARAIRIHLRNRRLRKQREAAKAHSVKVQARSPEIEDCEEPVVFTVISDNTGCFVA